MKELGIFTYTYKSKGKKLTAEFAVRDVEVSDFFISGIEKSEALKRYQGKRRIVVYNPASINGNVPAAYYSPYADTFEVSVGFVDFETCRNTNAQRQFEAQFRKVLPEFLDKGGYLDSKGNVIPDGNEAFRIKAYRWFISGEGRSLDNFVMPDEPDFITGDDEDNPLTWADTPERQKALVVYFRLMYQQTEALRHKKEEQAYMKIVYSLRNELYQLFEEHERRLADNGR